MHKLSSLVSCKTVENMHQLSSLVACKTVENMHRLSSLVACKTGIILPQVGNCEAKVGRGEGVRKSHARVECHRNELCVTSTMQ